MAILFSNVTVKSGEDKQSFFMGGGPTQEEDLINWTIYKNFVMEHRNIDSVKVDLYRDGEGYDNTATPAEIAHIMMKCQRIPNWLENIPTKIKSYELKV